MVAVAALSIGMSSDPPGTVRTASSRLVIGYLLSFPADRQQQLPDADRGRHQ
jgi:hypothetical protein